MTRILVIDNYDSFVYTLNGYLQELGAETEVVRNDSFDASDAAARIGEFDGVLVSPGPGKPSDAGVSIPVVHAALASNLPLFGVCLGHQSIGHVFGGDVVRAERLMHGKTSMIRHTGKSVFAGLPDPMLATRYHSLLVKRDTLPDCLEITAVADDDESEIMGLRHKEFPIHGVQFHPESILTQEGKHLLKNFLEM